MKHYCPSNAFELPSMSFWRAAQRCVGRELVDNGRDRTTIVKHCNCEPSLWSCCHSLSYISTLKMIKTISILTILEASEAFLEIWFATTSGTWNAEYKCRLIGTARWAALPETHSIPFSWLWCRGRSALGSESWATWPEKQRPMLRGRRRCRLGCGKWGIWGCVLGRYRRTRNNRQS